MNFQALGVPENFAKSLSEQNIIHPTEIQKIAIPFLLREKQHLVAQSPTGSGKTIAYGVPLLHRLDANKPYIQSIILVPTRELGLQVKKQLFKLTKYHSKKLYGECIYGGVDIGPQIQQLKRSTHYLVATPGRLIEMMDLKTISLKNVGFVVLDEADEMLKKGFKEDLKKILAQVKFTSRMALFSATFPMELKSIIRDFITFHHFVKVGEQVMNENVEQSYFICPTVEKFDILAQFLQHHKILRGIIFTRTKASAERLEYLLRCKNFAVGGIHGDKPQSERLHIMRAFKDGKLKYLVATDVAARGIDVPDVGFVVHYELPDTLDFFIHRSGRTARGMRKGISFSIVSPKELKTLEKFQDQLGMVFSRI